jgi:sulfur transfer complex TusBCD TusB component (DsrH family)
MKLMKYNLGYVASPLNAPTQKAIKKNMARARMYEFVINKITGTRNRAIQGYVPALLDDNIPEERQMGLEMGLKLLEKSDAIILCGHKLTAGMEAELKKAINRKKIFVLRGDIFSKNRLLNILLIKMRKITLEEITVGTAIAIMYTRRIF